MAWWRRLRKWLVRKKEKVAAASLKKEEEEEQRRSCHAGTSPFMEVMSETSSLWSVSDLLMEKPSGSLEDEEEKEEAFAFLRQAVTPAWMEVRSLPSFSSSEASETSSMKAENGSVTEEEEEEQRRSCHAGTSPFMELESVTSSVWDSSVASSPAGSVKEKEEEEEGEMPGKDRMEELTELESITSSIWNVCLGATPAGSVEEEEDEEAETSCSEGTSAVMQLQSETSSLWSVSDLLRETPSEPPEERSKWQYLFCCDCLKGH